MAITVKHIKVSTIADGPDTDLVRPSDWNDDHSLTGLGTMAEQDASSVAITGGTISGLSAPLDVPSGGTGASTLTGYVVGTGTSALTANSTIPNTDVTGLGTASTKDAGVANGVATLDSGGKVPVSQIPALGDLNYQGTWDASTNTPTLTSSVGVKGYYYVVSVAGSTNLDGITDWLVGDWAVYNGTVWQKIDNTDAVTSVNGYTGTVVLTATDVGAQPAGTYVTSVGGTSPISSSGGTTPSVSISQANTSTSGYLSSTDWNTFNNKGSGSVTSVDLTASTGISVSGGPITSSGSITVTNTAPDQTVVLTAGTGISTSGTYPNFTITNTSPSSGGDVVGPSSATDNAVARFDTTTGKLIQNSVVVVNDAGTMSGVESLVFDGSIPAATPAGAMWYDNATETLNFKQNNITQQIGEELFVYGKASAAITDSPLQIIYHTGTVGSSGVVTFAPTIAGITDENAIIGVATENIANNGFGRVTSFGVVHGITTNGTAFGETWADDDVIWYNPVTGNPTNVKPSAPNIKFQVGIVINAGSGGSGSFQVLLQPGTALGGTDSNVQLSSPTAAQLLTYSTTSGYWKNTSLASGTGISTSTNANGTLTVNNTGVTSAVAGTGISVSGSTGAVTVTNSAPDQTVVLTAGTGISTSGTYPNFTITNTSPSSGGTVTSVTGTSPVVSSGGNTPAISMPAATGSVNGYLTSTDWTTFNNKGSGTVTSVTGTAPVVSSGGATPAISMAAANTTTNGYLTSTDWNTFNGKGSGTVTAVSVTSANGFAGTSSGGATPALTLSTSISGVLKGNGTAISAATSGTDYSAGTSALTTGILKSTTTTGALSIAVAADFPTLNQNTTGSAATLTTPRAIYGNNFDGSAALTQIIASTYGGTGNGFTKFSGATTAEKTYTLPDASATLLYAGGPLGTPSSGTLTNATGLPVGGISATGTPSSSNYLRGDGTWASVTASSATNLAGGALGSVPYQLLSGTTSFLAGNTTTTPQFLTSTGVAGVATAPTYTSSTGSGNVVLATSPTLVTPVLGTPSSGTLTSCTGLPLSTGVTGTLPAANGGTAQSTYATGDILYASAANTLSKLTVGSTGQVLTVASGVPSWATASGGGATITGTTTAGTYYVVGTTLTSGTLSTASISNTNAVSYNANTGALTAVSMVSSSDERLKTDWEDLPVDFVENLAKVKHGNFTRIENGNKEVGVSAQSLQSVLEKAVVTDENGNLGVNYGAAALVAAIELAKEVQNLRAEIALLKSK